MTKPDAVVRFVVDHRNAQPQGVPGKGPYKLNQYRDFDNYLKEHPSNDGYFGRYGGNYLEDPELICEKGCQ